MAGPPDGLDQPNGPLKLPPCLGAALNGLLADRERRVFLFLAVVMDAWSRRIVGWASSAGLKTRVVLDALDMALAARKLENVIHHSDQGSQYASLAFGNRCRDARVRPSTGSVGDAYGNAMCESFFATLGMRTARSASLPLTQRSPDGGLQLDRGLL